MRIYYLTVACKSDVMPGAKTTHSAGQYSFLRLGREFAFSLAQVTGIIQSHASRTEGPFSFLSNSLGLAPPYRGCLLS